MSKSNSAQVNMLKKMRQEHTNQSALEKLIEQEKENKERSSTSEQETNIVKPSSSLISISTNECRPWDFADRSSSEMGNIEELANSIKTNGIQVRILANL